MWNGWLGGCRMWVVVWVIPVMGLAVGCGDEPHEGTADATPQRSNSTVGSTSEGGDTTAVSNNTGGGMVDAERVDCGGGVMAYVLDPVRHVGRDGVYRLEELTSLQAGTDLLSPYCVVSDESVIAGDDVAVRFTAQQDGVHVFESTSPATTLMGLLRRCNVSRQSAECAPMPYHLDPDFRNTPRRVSMYMQAGDLIHVVMDSSDSGPVNLTVYPPQDQGGPCVREGSGPVCMEGMVCACGRGCRCGAGSAPELWSAQAHYLELSPSQGQMTVTVTGIDRDLGVGGDWLSQLKLALLDDDQNQLDQHTHNIFVPQHSVGFEVSATFRGDPPMLARVSQMELVMVDSVGNMSEPLRVPVVVQELLGEGVPCDGQVLCAPGLACLAMDSEFPNETTCVPWVAGAFTTDEEGYALYVHAPEAAPEQRAEVFVQSAPGRLWFDMSNTYTRVSIEDPASGWERKSRLLREDQGVFVPPPSDGVPSRVWVTVTGGAETEIEVLAQPMRTMGERCDRDRVRDRCSAGGTCSPGSREVPFVCDVAEAPTVTNVRWFGDPDGETFGFEVEGLDPNQDLSHFLLERVDRARETFINAESASGVFDGQLSQFGVTMLEQEGSRFKAGWSVMDWPFSYLPQSVAWRLVLVDHEGLESAPVYSDAQEPVARPDAVLLGEPCDPYGLRAVCSDEGAVCDRLYRDTSGFGCRLAEPRCPEDWGSPLRFEEQAGGLWVAAGRSEWVQGADVAASPCFGRPNLAWRESPDTVLEFTAPRAGRYDAWVVSTGNTLHRLFARRLCALPHSSEVECAPVATAVQQVELEAGESLFLFVEAHASRGDGEFEVHIAQP